MLKNTKLSFGLTNSISSIILVFFLLPYYDRIIAASSAAAKKPFVWNWGLDIFCLLCADCFGRKNEMYKNKIYYDFISCNLILSLSVPPQQEQNIPRNRMQKFFYLHKLCIYESYFNVSVFPSTEFYLGPLYLWFTLHWQQKQTELQEYLLSRKC